MLRKISGRAAESAQSRRQALALITLGVVFLVLALLVHPSVRDYPIWRVVVWCWHARGGSN